TPSFSTRPCLPSGLNGVSPRIISAGHKPASQQRRNPGTCGVPLIGLGFPLWQTPVGFQPGGPTQRRSM
ncbi:hypothetical protein, partial [Mycobacterium marinum]|uniref:hypothetical protein n=1 Tax=Mycobacterium marinum TaxID=1781 RepID=UPI0021C3263A